MILSDTYTVRISIHGRSDEIFLEETRSISGTAVIEETPSTSYDSPSEKFFKYGKKANSTQPKATV